MREPIRQIYKDQLESTRNERTNLSSKEHILPVLRLIFFLIALILFYNYLIVSSFSFLYGAAFALLLFLILTSWDTGLKRKIERCDRVIQICQNELGSLDGDFSPFDSGDEYIDSDHSYTYDLDLFGNKSLFHCINRSVTIFGKNRLAQYFKDAFHFKDQILERQEAIMELSENHDFRQQMQLVFFGEKSNEKHRLEFGEWLKSRNSLSENMVISLLRYIFPVITNGLIVGFLLGFIVVQLPIIMVILQLFIVALYSRKTLQFQTLLSSKVETISKYANFLLLIEKSSFKSSNLIELKVRLSHNGIAPPSTIIGELFRLLNWIDTNLNILASVILNGLFMFNLHILVSVERWKTRYCEVIPRWFETMGELDALASLATFSANNPEFIFPVAVEKQFLFEASDMGHPLIARDECVTNDISISGWNQYCIITGANMSGKITFLRSIGTNYILAMLGAPVFASRFVFYPVILHSSIRTNDSLARKESFFYAELKRLQSIIAELESGQQTFILLDEILKGTNSKDKQIGSIALLEQLVKYQSVGLIATHDLILGDLVRDYPENIHNLCFEIQIVNGEMNIDYKLRQGVCKNLNATFLMKKMGILMNI